MEAYILCCTTMYILNVCYRELYFLEELNYYCKYIFGKFRSNLLPNISMNIIEYSGIFLIFYFNFPTSLALKYIRISFIFHMFYVTIFHINVTLKWQNWGIFNKIRYNMNVVSLYFCDYVNYYGFLNYCVAGCSQYYLNMLSNTNIQY